VAWTDELCLLPRAKELLIEEPGDLLEDDEGLILPGDAPAPLEKNMLRYNISVKVLRSETLAGGRFVPGPGGDGNDGDGAGPRRDRFLPRSRDLSRRRDGHGDRDQGRRRRDGSGERGGGWREDDSDDRWRDGQGSRRRASGLDMESVLIDDDPVLAALSGDRPQLLTDRWDPMLLEVAAASLVLPHGHFFQLGGLLFPMRTWRLLRLWFLKIL
jgi:hypothetical protein